MCPTLTLQDTYTIRIGHFLSHLKDNFGTCALNFYQVTTMPATLLTGANSFVGAHVINSLIAAGHTVVGTVRRENLIDQIYASHPEWKEKLELIVVKDYAEESSWDEVFAKHSLDHVRRRRLSFASVAACCSSHFSSRFIPTCSSTVTPATPSNTITLLLLSALRPLSLTHPK